MREEFILGREAGELVPPVFADVTEMTATAATGGLAGPIPFVSVPGIAKGVSMLRHLIHQILDAIQLRRVDVSQRSTERFDLDQTSRLPFGRNEVNQLRRQRHQGEERIRLDEFVLLRLAL